MPYIGTQPKDVRSFGRAQFDFTATQGQTDFIGADDDGKQLGYTEGQVQVYVNGILMDDADYNTSALGNAIYLTSAANLNDIITVVALQTDIPNSDYVPISGGTFSGDMNFSGDLTVGATAIHVDRTNNRLGVGTSSPSYLVDAKTSSGNAQARILSGGDLSQLILESTDTTGNSQINFADADSNNVGMLQYFHSDNHMEFTVNSLERMRIDSAGRVTMPYQPSFQAYSPASGTVSGANIVYGSTYHNIGNHYNTSTGIFTAPIAGRYLFTASCLFNYASSGYHRLDFRLNGSVYHTYGETLENQAGPSYSAATISNIFSLSANDTIQMHNGSNVSTYGSSYGHFSGIMLA